jgi:cytochrome P450
MFASIYSLHTNKLYFERPTEFLPERWLESVDAKARAAYQPFSTGSRSCPGKQLALQVLRLTIARLLTGFDGEYVGTVKDWVAESNCYAIYDSPPLLMKLRPMTRECSCGLESYTIETNRTPG